MNGICTLADPRQLCSIDDPIRLLAMPTADPAFNAPLPDIDALVHALLRVRDPDGYGEVLRRYTGGGRDLEPMMRWDSKRYTRSCVYRNERFELLVVCYGPGHSTSIHDYDSARAWVQVLEGNIREERFRVAADGRLVPEREALLDSAMPAVFTLGASVHRFSNPGPGPAVTLNLYARPLQKWRVYDESSGKHALQAAGG